MKMFWTKAFLHSVVVVAVAALTANYYHAQGQGYGMPIHPYVYYVVGGAVAILPVFWAVTHVCGGLLLGIASGGVMDGLRLGVLLGLGMALSKLWPAALGVAIGVWMGDGPLAYTILAAIAGALLFGLSRALHFFWKSSSSAV